MTEVRLTGNDGWFELIACGHADKNPQEDGNLCCAAESMLMQTALKTVYEMSERNMLEEFDYKKEPGCFYLKAEAVEDTECQAMIEGIRLMLESGFKLIDERYPGRIIRGEK